MASPLGVHDALIPIVTGPVVADIGFGSGFQATVLDHQMSMHDRRPERFVGVEFSAKAVKNAPPVFRRVYRASSVRLPLKDRSVDSALSVNCLEHLWADQVRPAIAEMARVSRGQVVIVTPWPENVEIWPFLDVEGPAALADPDPLGKEEFGDLVGYLHKCVLTPKSMLAAGFTMPLRLNSLDPVSAIYVGQASEIRAERIEVLGLSYRAWPRQKDYRKAYAGLVGDCARMGLARHRGWRFPYVCVLSAVRHLLASYRVLKWAWPF